jgi:hypothetical protein
VYVWRWSYVSSSIRSPGVSVSMGKLSPLVVDGGDLGNTMGVRRSIPFKTECGMLTCDCEFPMIDNGDAELRSERPSR